MSFCTKQLAPGDPVIKWNGEHYRLRAGEHGLVARDSLGNPLGFIFWSEERGKGGPRPYIPRRYVYLYSAWVSPRARGQGVFRLMMRRLMRLYPATPLTGAATNRGVRQTLNRLGALPARTYPGYYPD